MPNVRISLLSDSKKVLLEKKLSSIPLREENLIKKSIEFFDDPAPCMIHRSAVMLRLYMEILEYLEKHMEKETQSIMWKDVPEHLRNYLSVEDSNVIYVMLTYI